MVITGGSEMPQLASSYSGQGIATQVKTNLNFRNIQEWLRWVFYRKAPEEKMMQYLWVREDVFPGDLVMAE